MSADTDTDPVTDDRGPRSNTELLRDPSFGPFVAANLVSNSGNWFHVIAAALAIYELTGSARMVSLVSVSTFGIFTVLAPVAGSVTDRVDRRQLLIVTQIAAIAAAGILSAWAWVGLGSIWPVVAMTAVLGLSHVFSIPAMLALVPGLVPAADLGGAIGLNTVAINIARVIGPAAAAVVIGAFGTAAAFGVNALSFVMLLVVLIRYVPRQEREATDADITVRGGYRYIRRDRRTWFLLAGVAAIGVSMDPTSTLTPPFADLFGGGGSLVGWLVAAFGGGAVLATAVAPRLRARWRNLRHDVLGLVLCSAGLVLLAASPVVSVALAGYGLLGAGYLLAITDITTKLQREVPEFLRGRLMAVWSQVLLGARPFAAGAAGWISDSVSPRMAALALATVPAIAALVVRRTPERTVAKG